MVGRREKKFQSRAEAEAGSWTSSLLRLDSSIENRSRIICDGPSDNKGDGEGNRISLDFLQFS